MPKSCGAPHCSNAAGQPRPPARRLSFYKFPLRDAARLRQWLAQMRRDNWLPTRHHHLCSDHFEPSCFQYRWGVRYLRPDAVPTIFPRGPPKQEGPGTPPGAAQPQRPSPSRGTEPAAPARHRSPESAAPQAAGTAVPPAPYSPPAPAVPETVPSAASPPPAVAAVPAAAKAPPARELSTEELVGVALVLQRKVKVLQQRQRRHRARLEAMEELVEQLRRESLLCEERLQLACLQPVTPDPAGALAIICREEEEAAAALLCAVPPPAGPHRGLERL